MFSCMSGSGSPKSIHYGGFYGLFVFYLFIHFFLHKTNSDRHISIWANNNAAKHDLGFYTVRTLQDWIVSVKLEKHSDRAE